MDLSSKPVLVTDSFCRLSIPMETRKHLNLALKVVNVDVATLWTKMKYSDSKQKETSLPPKADHIAQPEQF